MDNNLLLLILAFFLLVFLVYKTSKVRMLSNILLLGATMLFLLLAIEFVYRLTRDTSKRIYKVEPKKGFYMWDSILGFKIQSPGEYHVTSYNLGKKDTLFKTIYTIVGDTQQLGIDYPRRMAYKAGAPEKVIFLGCSFTFGEGIRDTSTLPYQYGRMANVSTVNMGYNSYGLHNVYEVYRNKFASQDNTGKVFVYSLLSDHLLRANGAYHWNPYGPYFIIRNDSIINTSYNDHHHKYMSQRPGIILSLNGSLTFIKDYFHKYYNRKKIAALSQEDYDRYFLMLKDMAKSIQRSKGRLIVINWDYKKWHATSMGALDQPKFNRDVLALNGDLMTVVPVSKMINLDDQKNFIPVDGHPTEYANSQISKHLFKLISSIEMPNR